MTEHSGANSTATPPIDALFSTPAMSNAFSAEAHVRGMLRFEAALALAEARAGIIPQDAATSIAAQCREKFFDIAALYHEAASAGTPAIPLVRMLTARVEGEAKKFVHWGATSQDAIDTALMLQMRAGIDLLLTTLGQKEQAEQTSHQEMGQTPSLYSIGATCAMLAEQHRHTPMVGRTLLQQALPLTFGLKAARWLGLVTRQVLTLRECRDRLLVVQLGGASGTLASLGDNGLRVVEFLAAELQLAVPDLPWHTERDRIGEIAGTLGVIAGSMAKIAGDLALLAQTEVGETSEGTAPGKGGSSAMPHKHNPIDATSAIASARLAIGTVPVLLSAMAQEHERAIGAWQAEWAAIPDLFRFTARAVDGVRSAIAGLQINPTRMQANLNLTGGLVMAESLTMTLATHIGRPEAYRIVQALCNHIIDVGGDLHQAAMADAQVRDILTPDKIDHALDPTHYLGSTQTFINRALAAYHALPS